MKESAMTYSPAFERELRQSARQARMVAFTCCFVAPAMYIITLGSQAFRGQWHLFLGGFGRLPWADPRVPGALAVAVLALSLALVLPPRLGRAGDDRATLGALKARNLLSSALLVAVAVCGLFLGVKIGPPAASLSLVLFLATMVRGWFVLPSESRWRQALAEGGGPDVTG
jgi:hypothetical protein